MTNQLDGKEILKEEKVGYLKSKLSLLQGTLFLTKDELILEAHKTGVGGLGLLGSFLKKKVEKKNLGFKTNIHSIIKIEQGKHGVQKNVLEINLSDGATHRIIVKDFQDWKNAIETLQKKES